MMCIFSPLKSLACFFVCFSTAYAAINPSLEKTSPEETSYQLCFRDKEPQHPQNMHVSFHPSCNYRGQFLSFNRNQASFIQVDFLPPEGFSEKTHGVELRLSHLAAMLPGNHCHCNIAIHINNSLFLESYDPSDGKISNDSFDITKWVKEGPNTISIRLLNGPSQYWLHDLHLTFFQN